MCGVCDLTLHGRIMSKTQINVKELSHALESKHSLFSRERFFSILKAIRVLVLSASTHLIWKMSHPLEDQCTQCSLRLEFTLRMVQNREILTASTSVELVEIDT